MIIIRFSTIALLKKKKKKIKQICLNNELPQSAYGNIRFCFLTQDFGSLVGSRRQRPVRSVVVPSQLNVQVASERLVFPSCDQPSSLKHTISLSKLCM